MNQDYIPCRWCGKPSDDTHHLFRRSTSPEMIDDPNNHARLCRLCHQYATKYKEVEQLFQYYFFLKPEQEKITVEHIAKSMQDMSYLSPRDVARFRNFLAGEYCFLSNRFQDLERQEPFMWEQLRKTVKSDARADKLYRHTEQGIEQNDLKQELKKMEKMLSALKTNHEQLMKEGNFAGI